MQSKWYDLKAAAIEQRKQGVSMTVIEREMGIPRSTLSLWFRSIKLTEDQRTRLMKNKSDGWKKARENAVKSHRAQKELRLIKAKEEALSTISNIMITDQILDLALAMLYLGEGAKQDRTSIASSDPAILRFVLTVLKRNYAVKLEEIRCDLHLRMDQDSLQLKQYWSEKLGVPIENFRYVAYDKRSVGRPTYDHYKGVCVITCGNIAIQRKLIYLYSLFMEKIDSLDMGV